MLDRVHALLEVVADRRVSERPFLFLVLGEHLDISREEAFLGVRPELDLSLAPDREAGLARELRVLVRLADDELDRVVVARGDARLVAVASSHELDEPPRELRLERAQADAARGFGADD